MTAAFHIEKRLSEILEGAVREFIESGEPVSSGRLYRRYDFGIRPARIRSELQTLTDLGYLEQPYHSAGRVPTDEGYQYFAEGLVTRYDTKPPSAGASERTLASLFEKNDWPDFLEALSDRLGLLGVLWDRARGDVEKSGLRHLVEHLEWRSPETIRDVIEDFEAVGERIAPFRKKTASGSIRIFVGERSPFTRSRQLAVVAGEAGTRGEKSNVLLLAIGPKRMDYGKVIRVFRELIVS